MWVTQSHERPIFWCFILYTTQKMHIWGWHTSEIIWICHFQSCVMLKFQVHAFFLNTHATSLISWFVGEHRQNPSEEAEFPALIIICIQANLEARGGEFEFLNSWIWPRKKGGWLTKHMLNQLKTKKTKKMMRAVCRKQTHWQSNSVKG